MPRLQSSLSSVSNQLSITDHQPPRPNPRLTRGRLLDPQAFAKIENPAMESLAITAVEVTVANLSRRLDELQSAKGGPLFATPSMFAVPSVSIDGYLGLIVDEQQGEVRRRGLNVAVSFQVGSVPWEIFLIAWESGATGCSVENWLRHKSDMQIEGISKYHSRNVNNKLAVLGLRLELRRPPRLVEITQDSR